MKRLFILTLVIYIFNTLSAQNHKFLFRHYNIENGLSSNCIQDLLIDHKGFLWIATDNGLSKYDGTRFINYQRRNTHNHLGSNSIISLFEDRAKYLYIGTERGLYQYDYARGQFKLYSPRIHSSVYDIAKDGEGMLWITKNGEILRINNKNKTIKKFKLNNSSEIAYKIYIDHNGKIWTTTSSALYYFDKHKRKFKKFIVNGRANNIYSFAICEDYQHNLWIGSWDGKLIKINTAANTCKIISGITQKKLLHIHSITEYKNGELFIGSDNGLMLYNTKNGKSQLFISNARTTSSLSDQFIYPVIKDHEGGIWIGTYYEGVDYIPPYCGQFERFGQTEDCNYINGKIISRFCQDNNNNVWIASDDGGVNCFSPKRHSFINYPGKKFLSKVNAHAFCIDHDNLWIGTYSEGLIILNINNGKTKVYNGKNSPINGNSVYALYRDKKENIWIGTMNGAFLYVKKQNRYISLENCRGLVIDIKEDSEGNIWFATQGDGIYIYRQKKKKWSHYNDKNKKLPAYINSVCMSSDGKILVGTSEGLYIYNKKEDKFQYIHLHIPNETINCIIQDKYSYWLTTAKGLVKYTPGKNIKIFTKSDGLQSEGFVSASGLMTRNGEIFIGTINGFNTFYPQLIHQNKITPPVVLTGIEIFNKELPIDPDGILPAPIGRMKEIHFSHSDNVISIQYAALSYCTPGKNQYAYKLAGFDKDWNYVGNQTKATYTNLPAGEYNFMVKACNNDGIWNNKGASIRIIIHPPFYLTLPFKIMYILIFCYSIYIILHLTLKRNERRHLVEVEKIKTNKEKEIQEAKINFFTIIAHEIRTPVSLIIGPLEKIMQSTRELPEHISDNLKIIDRNSQRLLNLINQLLDFRKVEQENLKLRFTKENINEIVRSVSERFIPYLNQNNITIKIQMPPSATYICIDREAITKVISNLLNNATKYARHAIIIKGNINSDGKTFNLSIKDDGKGMDEKELEHIFKPFYQVSGNKPGTGIGLSIVKGYVEAHHGMINVTSELDKGSEFTVTIPIQQELCIANENISTENFFMEPKGNNGNNNADEKKKSTILLVDDNEDMLFFLSESLKDSYHITTATDGIKALEYLKKNRASIIISDWMMPNMNGIEFCEAVRKDEKTSHIPFVLLTARTDTASKVTGMNYGADLYIEKPFSPQYLCACIHNLIEMRKRLRKTFSERPSVPIDTISNNDKDKKFLSLMYSIIEKNISNSNFSVDYLAKELCVSRSGLFAKIKGIADVTPNEMIQIIRLRKAAALLLENKYQISEICFQVGFNSPSYFAKCFQKQFGKSPSEYTGS